MDSLRLVTLNSNGLRVASKRRAIFKNLRKLGADFILLQETHSTHKDEKIWLMEWGGEGVFSHGLSNSRGVCTLLHRHSSFSIVKSYKDTDGRFLILQLSKDNESITLVNIYAPTSSEPTNQMTVMNNLLGILSGIEVANLMLAGDFNLNFINTEKFYNEEYVPHPASKFTG